MTATERPTSDLESAILAELAGGRAVHLETLCEALEADPVAVGQACFRLETEGAIRPRSDGAYVRLE